MKNNHLWRTIAIAVFYGFVTVLFIGRLIYLQVSGQDYYSMSMPSRQYTRTVTIQAQRGEIFDRNGKPLVVNDYSYNISADYSSRPDSKKGFCDMLLDFLLFAERSGADITEPKSSLDIEVLPDGLRFTKPEGFEETVRGKRYAKLISQLHPVESEGTDGEGAVLMDYFGITSKEKNDSGKMESFCNYTWENAKRLFLIRLDMELSGFAPAQPYVLASGVSTDLIAAVEEKYSTGFLVSVKSTRHYLYPGYASHILGLVNKIPADKLEQYTEQGYPMDAVVGISGAEAAFENYLRGSDGTLAITEDEYGNVLNTEIIKQPEPGRDVYLTIDIDMQMTAERALAENIRKIREEADPEKPLTGEDAYSGALTVLDADTFDTLAMCSYPTFNLATFSKDWPYLSNDELNPMFNRALFGAYAPGSTFKIGVAVAALSEGTITKDTIIEDEGIYRYYENSKYTPRCWLYLLTNGEQTHGRINVVEAIQESCNYFFYEVGRNLTISKMNEYCKKYGLGQSTGIELPESTGILASPDYRAENGLGQWSPGDTLQAAIGQSDNQFTPLQISVYLATVLNGGTRYSAGILHSVKDYATDQVIYSRTPKVLDTVKIDKDILSTVKEGMRGVMDNGSAASVFRGYEISVGGKTGTAQVYENKSDNGIMTAFAPFENPEIVVTCVIEQGSGGTQAGYAVRDV
ncbi:MAG: hypothetical protein IJU57_00795, partial [Clostridia bacterium]|nr:hypothetical protein [Clostridia bacterium]